ncbi:hypothetical protein HBI56_180150 [Parastagonospora nodorum]|nr:hypothetical protein HBH51_211840 [Parastagonospora nodorum]KAH3962120.1 hypothetical protein HBH52_226040 [Parastagonospora nodorum]KAH3992037.1 hypothetical protein HBI10_221790 [Parastagonospora nodorum]KAH4009664.1 hypothetical protein HBI13_217680 [Parastagonospora nodorum]KAH4043545.1 hypothetical protein HBH49_231790 [Parastagonospora nodorum]
MKTSGVSRFLSRRDKHHEKRSSKATPSKSRLSNHASPDLYTIFTNEDAETAADKDTEKKVKMLLTRLHGAGITRMREEQAQYALSWSPDDIDKAYDILVLANESLEGELKDYDPNVQMLGAINRNMVTCYLDALLFAMFARLDSFEAMLYDNFEDEPRMKLAAVLRLWVNLLRTGQLIRVELTQHLQDSLAKCGWEEAAEICQQDASEAFTFITGALELPLLTLKMDIYHTGREDKEDDHRFVNERLLEVAIPEQDGDHVITLEDCLETYFNNRIEVKRYLQRQNTIASIKSTNESTVERDPEKSETLHIETVELLGPESPLVATPTAMEHTTPATPTRPQLDGRRRADSIFSQRLAQKTPEEKAFNEKAHLQEMLDSSSNGRPRSASLLRKEILMPAWQFFSLIPWYTDNVPKSDAQVAAHFSVKRPVLGICLKRYTMTPNGSPKRLETYIDIPLEIGLPHFISDERMKDEGPLFGNFKLVLQSVVCHRGVSVDSGHYVSLVRANDHERPGTSQSGEGEIAESWLRFDDLANPRVAQVDIKQALREESPYLLFYQVQPIDEELAMRGDPPAYELQSGLPSMDPSRETLASAAATDTDAGEDGDTIAPTAPFHARTVSNFSEEPISRNSLSSNRRSSTAIDDTEGSARSFSRGRTAPPTPDEHKNSFLSISRRGSRIFGTNRSRPSSPSGENRLSFTLSRLTGRGSKDKLIVTESATSDDPVIVIDEVISNENIQSPTKEKKDGTLSRSKSKKEKKDKSRSKSKEPGEALDKAKHKEKNRPDRECAVM